MMLVYPEVLFRKLKRIVAGESQYSIVIRDEDARLRAAPPLGQRLRGLGRALRSTSWRQLRAFRHARTRSAR
jgi:hypothetical protein